ncbi:MULTISPECIES: HK97 gp10 family phage protein [unclassified Pantoea]|uniref:HK97 gp10 family phage protein n=1 Tax=Pantoea TaxID=53335 RepID=UPI002269861E|nr:MULTISPECIES: HK97 gp10 family phage protein [unclassified Pantoea]
MGVKVKGIQQAQRNMNALINDIEGRKIVRALKSATIIIGSEAAILTPRDTSTLINSQYTELLPQGSKIIGRIGYTASYAAAVHNASGKLKGKPRAHFGRTANHSEFGPKRSVEFGGGTGVGNYWDPNAEPQFLLKGAVKAKDTVDAVMKKELKL